MTPDNEEVDWEAADRCVDNFTAVVRHHLAGITAAADAEGYRRTTAAALLLRGLELLDAARKCREPVQFPAAELVLRSGVDVALKGRYLLASPDAQDELQRMHGAYVKRKKQLSQYCGEGTLPSVPEAFAAAVPPSTLQERNLYDLANTIDEGPKNEVTNGIKGEATKGDVDAHASRKLRDMSSAMCAYRCLYQWMSNAAAHSGLYAIERFTIELHGVAAVTTTPEPLSNPERRHYILVASQLSELARAVFSAFDLPLADLDATGVCLPHPSGS